MATERLRAIGMMGAVLALAGCHQLTPKQQETLDLFECRVHVLVPYVDSVLDAAELVREVAKGQTNLVHTLAALGYVAEDIAKIAAELGACQPQPVVVAPPPLPGDEVL